MLSDVKGFKLAAIVCAKPIRPGVSAHILSAKEYDFSECASGMGILAVPKEAGKLKAVTVSPSNIVALEWEPSSLTEMAKELGDAGRALGEIIKRDLDTFCNAAIANEFPSQAMSAVVSPRKGKR